MIANDRSSDDDEKSIGAPETVLQNDRRREILSYLAEHGGEVGLSSLALSLTVGGDETLSAIIEQLHECHLPRLAAHDLLVHESAGTVRLLIEPDRAEELVVRVEAEGD